MNLFRRNLLLGYAGSLLLLIASSVASYSSIKNLLNSQYLVNHTNTVIYKLEQVLSVLKDAETGQRGFLLTGNQDFLVPYYGSMEKAEKAIDDVQTLTADNFAQQQTIQELRDVAVKRIATLQTLIDSKKNGSQPTIDQLKAGNIYMLRSRALIQDMENREQTLLSAHLKSLNRFTDTTPLFIIIASIIAIIVTLISFIKVNKDLDKRMLLQKELEEKDKEISDRLNIIEGIAEKISTGNYTTRVSDEGKDVLGSLSGSLNKMAASLDASFTSLKKKEWLQKGLAGLSEKMLGEKSLDALTYNIIEFICNYINAPLGAFYIAKNNFLTLYAGISLGSNVKKQVSLGEDIAGQCAASGKQIIIDDVPETNILINYSAGSIKPATILATPVFYEGNLKAVIEIGIIKAPYTYSTDFLNDVVHNIGMAIQSAQDHQRLHELLQETQSQSEELQTQHSELENINTELETQSEKLQASEEELRVQQEELQQANQELEERSRLLEEKNELITERNLSIQAKSKELELSTKYKSEFLANMSHELRTPLNSILLLSRLMAENPNNNLNTDQIEYANVIQNSGKGLLTLINEILDLSKIEAGKMELEFAEINIIELVNEFRLMFEPVAKDKNILFKITTQNTTAEEFETDRLRLEQILRNLISNALKFTKKGSVILDVYNDDLYITFSVKDTGIGVAKENQQTIFEAFQQADGSTRRQYGGTGLGLSISRQLTNLLGGEITVNSDEGKGSEFKLIIPLNRKQIQQPKKAAENIIAYNEPVVEKVKSEFLADIIPASIPDDRHNINDADKVILIIEDDTMFAKQLLNFTRKNNYKAIVAVRGDEGIELAVKFKPVGILLDIQLPVKSGWQVMDELKAKPGTRSIPVHIMSSFEARQRSLSAGAIDFINKPAVLDKLSAIFTKIESALVNHPKKVFIIEENLKHAQALAYFLEKNNISSEIKNTIQQSADTLNNNDADCVILETATNALVLENTLETITKTPGLENVPIIIFTGKNLSAAEEIRMKKYADSIVVKTAHSYQRILDEIFLFLHVVERSNEKKPTAYKKLGVLNDVLKNKTALIADDDVRNIYALTKALEQYGMKIISAMDGEDALKQLEKNKVDIVLMDMMMPQMDGYESIMNIRRNANYKNLPVIAVTAKAMLVDREKCIKAGASDYITKPIDVDQLTSLLRVWLYEV